MYAYQMDVAQPISMYDQVHAEVQRRLGKPTPDECLMHLATATDGGFRITEVWTSHEACDRFSDEVLRPIIGEVVGQEMLAAGPPPSTELDVRALELHA
jgi:hypothetical protein